MTRHVRGVLLAAVAAVGMRGMSQAARGTILDGVQPAALDQPQINVVIYLQGQDVPQINVTVDPLGWIYGTGDYVYSFNVPAYLDTGASGILFATSTVQALNLTTEQIGGTDVIYSDVGVAGTDDFRVSTPLHLGLAPYIPGQDLDQFSDANHAVPIVTPYTTAVPTAAGTNLRVQVGQADTTGAVDEFDQLIASLGGAGGVPDVVGGCRRSRAA